MKKFTSVLEKIKYYLVLYIAGLILSEKGKWCTSIAKKVGVKHDTIYRFLTKFVCLNEFLSTVAQKMIAVHEQNKKGYLIIDDTAISKIHAKSIYGIGAIYNSATKNSCDKGFSVVLLLWTNEIITIPIAFKIWFNEEVIGKTYYHTKGQLAQELLSEYKDKIGYEQLIIDGLYNNKELRHFYAENNIPFVSKMRRNNLIEIDNVSKQVQHHPALRLKRNERMMTKKALCKGLTIFITVYKRKNKDGSFDCVYLASNQKLLAQEYVKLYEKRWCVEVVFRSTKQRLGLGQCSARKTDFQKNHMAAVFLAYIFLQNEKYLQNLPNVEAVINRLSDVKTNVVLSSIHRFSQIISSSA